jgi:hypothetical protein
VPLAERFAAEIEWLKARHAEGAVLATACSGAMLLAEAGLLDGQDATTHWAWCDALRERHPSVKVREQRALVVTGEGQRLVMAGGGTTWLDLAIYSCAQRRGRAAMVARITSSTITPGSNPRAPRACAGWRCRHRALPGVDRRALPRTQPGDGAPVALAERRSSGASSGRPACRRSSTAHASRRPSRCWSGRRPGRGDRP